MKAPSLAALNTPNGTPTQAQPDPAALSADNTADAAPHAEQPAPSAADAARAELLAPGALSTGAALPELPESVLSDAKKLVQTVGFALTEDDAWAFGFCACAVDHKIRNACNLPETPEGLYPLAARLIAAAFLTLKQTSPASVPDAPAFEPALKELREGDTALVFDTEHTANASQRLDAFLDTCRAGWEQLVRFRRLSW